MIRFLFLKDILGANEEWRDRNQVSCFRENSKTTPK